MNTCHQSGCARRVAGYSNLCATHAKRKRRHGHPAQQGVTRERLRPYVNLVRSYVARHGGEASWAKLEAVLTAVTKDAAGVVAEAQSGRPFHLIEASAAAELLRVVESAKARAIVETVAAMAILQQREPNAFRSDNAGWVQTVRRFRALSTATKQRRYSSVAGRVKAHARELRQDVATVLGRNLQTTLGQIGVRISEGDHTERQRRAVTAQEAYAALRPAMLPSTRSEGETAAGP